jgi:hypothetical protein
MNLCPTCGEDFGSVSAFDKHRLGNHEYVLSEERPDGRRCLTPEEMQGRGMKKDKRGRWRLAARETPPWTSDVRAKSERLPRPGPIRHPSAKQKRRRDTSPRGSA